MNWKAVFYMLAGYVFLLCCSYSLIVVLAGLHNTIAKIFVTSLWAWILVVVALNGKEMSNK